MQPVVYPYALASETAKNLAEVLGTKRVKPDGFYRYRQNDLIINWGNSHRPNWDVMGVKILNHWDKVKNATNKLATLEILKQNNVTCVEFTRDINVAKGWIGEGKVAVCRTVLNGHSGFPLRKAPRLIGGRVSVGCRSELLPQFLPMGRALVKGKLLAMCCNHLYVMGDFDVLGG